jgi:UDP-N-acetylmuramate--alanine ligase
LKCTVVFQPHLFTRTRDFAEGFAESLDLADETVLLPIYPARELPIEGVTSKLVFDKMKSSNKYLMSKDELMDMIKGKKEGLLITSGAGDIDTMVGPLKAIFEKTN